MTLPERLGRLRRVDRIGAGGFATVWLYHDDDLDSPVAVKALADNWAQRVDVRERFLEEARMLRRADSEHVVRVYDIGEVDQTPYFVMSYADRGSLATLVEDGPVDRLRVVDLVCQAGEGVRVLHRRGIIHRDIKPQNLLLRSGEDDAEQVLVADLGVAKAMLHASGLTQVVGTPAYMAPEQAMGLGIDVRADVHALGAVAYHLMTGRFAREGGIGDLADPRRPPAPSSIRPELAPYDEVLLRALEPRADDRWPDVASFVSALHAAARLDDGTATPLPTPPPAPASPVPSPPPSVLTPERTVASPATIVEPAALPVGGAPRRRGRRPLLVAVVLIAIVAVAGASVALARALSGGSAGADGSPPTSPAVSATTGTPTPAPDIDFPPLGQPALDTTHQLVSPLGERWTYAVPKGWTVTDLDGGAPTDNGRPLDDQNEVRWRPQGEPTLGGYSLRYKALDPTVAPATMGDRLLRALMNARYTAFDLVRSDDDELWFTYIDAAQHLRYNYFRWVPNAAGKAIMEISVAGRKVDSPGLAVLLGRAAASVHAAR